MDHFETETIKKNLPELLTVTDCNVLLIAELVSRNALSPADVAELKAEANSITRNGKLYDILQTRPNGFKDLKESLAKTSQSGALKLLDESTGSTSSLTYTFPSSEPVFFNILPPIVLFTGRQEELQALEESLQQPGFITVISGKSYITGLGGIGKTDLARKLIQNICKNFEYTIWINAEDNISTSKDFKILARDKFGLNIYSGPGQEKDISVILDDVYSRLALKTSLLVFDNVENASFIQKYLPKVPHSASNIYILITSQDNDWDLGTHIRLSGLQPTDAVNFMKKGLEKLLLSDENFDDDVLQLVTRLEFFPLAIGQAIAFIRERKRIQKTYGPREYLYDLDKNTEAILNRPISGFLSLTGYNKSTYITLKLTFERHNEHESNGKTAFKLIRLMAFMAPDHIEGSIFEEIDSFVLEVALLLLERFSIIRLVSKKAENAPLKIINIHRLVQHVMRCVLESEDQTEGTLEKAVELLQNKMKFSNVYHAISIWHHLANVAKLPKVSKQIFLKHHLFPEQIFWILLYKQRLVDALGFVNFVLTTYSEHFDSEEHCELFIKYEICVARVLELQTGYSECKNYVQKVLERVLKYKKPNNHYILILRHIRAGLHLDYLDASEKALQEYCKLYDDWKHILGDKENIDSLNTLFKIGYEYNFLKKYEHAIATYKKVCLCITTLQITPANAQRVKMLDLETKMHMANTYASMGNVDEAVI